jgi:flagellar motor switch protein FliN/FliY
MSPIVRQLAQTLSSRFVGVLQSVVTPEAQPLEVAEPVAPGWLVPCELSGPIAGTCYLAVGDEDASRLAGRVLMMDAVSPDDIAEALKELTAQAFSGIGLASPFTGLTVAVAKPMTAPVAPGTAVGSFGCRLDDATAVRVGCSFAPGAAAAARETAAPAVAAAGAAAPAPPTDNLSLILDIDMPLTVRFGEAVVSLDALSRLGPGSLVELSRQPDDPVDVLINGRLVARGEVVVVGGNYGVRVTEVVSAAERMRTLHA